MFPIRFFFWVIVVFASMPAKAQLLQEDSAAMYWQQLTAAGSNEKLFVHLDKSIYTNNEQIWFSAYFLNRQSPLVQKQEFISVSLSSPQTKKVYLESKFIAADGFSFGNLSLPDTIPPGNYLFTAFGNVADAHQQPLAVYQQLITIKSVIKNNFRAFIQPLDSLSTREKFYVQVRAENLSYLPLKKAEVIYSLDGVKKEIAYTNNEGFVNIALPKKEQKGMVQVRVNYDNEFQFLSAIIPALKNDTAVVVQFYPESGALMSGVRNHVLMRVQTAAGTPIATKAVLYRNNIAEDTLLINSSGLCSFSVVPFEKEDLYIQLPERATDSAIRFALPQPAADAVIISTDHAVFADTLRFQLSAAVPKDALLFVYTEDQLITATRISLGRQKMKIIFPFDTSNRYKGMYTVTISDTAGNTLAQRLFFSKPNHPSPVTIQTDKTSYTRHEKVKINIRLNEAVMSTDLVTSIAVVQANRLLTINQPDIESANWIASAPNQLPVVNGRAVDNKAFMEQLLMMGIAKETKQPHSSIDSNISLLQVKANLTIENKKPKRPEELLLFMDTAFAMIETDSSGVVTLLPELITTEQGKRILLALNKSGDKLFSIELNKQFIDIANGLAQQHSFEHPVLTRAVIAEELPKDDIPGIKRLKEIVVTAKPKNDLFGTGPGGNGANECGDYVCIYTILNCPNHFNDALNKPPKNGDRVYTTTSRTTKIIYTACTNTRNGNFNRNTLKVPGIYMAKEFFGVEQEQKDMAEPEYRSTIFWRPGLVIKPGVNTELTFLTSDITGPFKIIVQGITSDGTVYYKEAKFTVVY